MKRYQRIEDLRTDKDLSQEKMAQLLKTSKTQYQRFENSDGNNFFENMIMIAKIHNVSLDYIAGLTNDKGGLHKNTPGESDLLEKYNALSDIRKGRVLQLIDILTEEQQNEKAQSQETA